MAQGGLDARDRVGAACTLLVLALVVFLASYVPAKPYRNYRNSAAEVERLKQSVAMAEEMMAQERQDLQRQEQLMDRIGRRPQGFDLWSFVNRTLREAKLHDRCQLENKQPSSRTIEHADNLSMVELELAGVKLEQLVDLLHQLYASKNVIALYKLESLHPAPDGNGLECSMTLISPKG